MKKTALIIALTFALSISVFAGDGNYPVGGKTCPNNQTTCLVSQDQTEIENTDQNSTKNIFDYLKDIFGF